MCWLSELLTVPKLMKSVVRCPCEEHVISTFFLLKQNISFGSMLECKTLWEQKSTLLTKNLHVLINWLLTKAFIYQCWRGSQGKMFTAGHVHVFKMRNVYPNGLLNTERPWWLFCLYVWLSFAQAAIQYIHKYSILVVKGHHQLRIFQTQLRGFQTFSEFK